MPEMNLTQLEKRILTESNASKGQARKAARKIAHMYANMQEVFDFYEGLRILGIHTDSTARDAIHNVEGKVAA